jgi:hypothetical protein
MNCLEFRRIVGSQPHLDSTEVREHAAACESCTRYLLELRRMDQLIYRALTIDVDAPKRSRHVSARYWRLAASVVVAVVLGAFLWSALPRASLAEQLAAHAQGEASALVRTADRIEPSDLAAVFKRSGVRLRPDEIAVSYAMSCWFRGHFVPHLVVQTDRGPVTVLVLPHERTVVGTQLQHFEDGGFKGVIVPAPQGVLAVLGRDAPVEEAAAQVLLALDYESGSN